MFKINRIFFTVPLSESIGQKIRYLFIWIYCRIFIRDKYVTERYRPVDVQSVDKNFLDKTEDVAILMRGQVIKSDDFTKKTLKMYRYNYPKSPIFLSTWNNCIDSNFHTFAEKYSINLILTKFKSPKTGYRNDNLQIIGNVRGLEEIIKKSIRYTLTTRTDQRFYNNNLLMYLKNIHSYYPYLNSQNPKDKQIERLLAMSFDTFMFKLYGIGDMFLFGLSKDVFNYWNSEKDKRIFDTEENKNKIYTLKSQAKARISEVYFMTEFLKRNGHELKWTLHDYFQVIKDRFIIIDSASMDFFWPKYTFFEERFKDFEDIKYKEISYSDWILIKNKQLSPNEKILDRPIISNRFKSIKKFFKRN